MMTTYLIASNRQLRQKEFLYFENVCRDINKYADLYDIHWADKYFEDQDYISQISTTKFEVYYLDNFDMTKEKNKATFCLSYEYEDATKLKINVDKYNAYTVIKDLEYGDLSLR